MARLYADECFSRPVVNELRRLGHDVLTAHEAGQASQRIPDAGQLAFAITQGRAVVSFNRRHFKYLHTTATRDRGIIVCTRDDDVVVLAKRIDDAITGCPTLDDQLLDIKRPSAP